jgi:hypothetical protein
MYLSQDVDVKEEAKILFNFSTVPYMIVIDKVYLSNYLSIYLIIYLSNYLSIYL